MKDYRKILMYFNFCRTLFFYYLCLNSKYSDKVKQDLSVWKKRENRITAYSDLKAFSWLAMNTKEFRNVMLNRLHNNKFSYVICRILFKPLDSLYINMPPEKIGGGLYIQHGFSTVIAANEIGENCSINQQVTIGFVGKNAPVIGNGVSITAGSIVIGNVHIGDNAFIGAGSVVTHDVAENDTVVGVPAKPIKKKS